MSLKPLQRDIKAPVLRSLQPNREIFKHDFSSFFSFLGDNFGLPGSGSADPFESGSVSGDWILIQNTVSTTIFACLDSDPPTHLNPDPGLDPGAKHCYKNTTKLAGSFYL
jgi:hypothetical protein